MSCSIFQDSLREVFLKQGVCKDEDDESTSVPLNLHKLSTSTDSEHLSESTDPTVARLEYDEISKLLMPPPWGILGPRPTAASLGMTASIEECMKTSNDQVEKGI